MSALLLWDGGGTAALVALQDDRVELVSSRAFAPGSRPFSTLDGTEQRLWLKVHGSHRRDDGAYQVTGRLLNVTRALRALLERSLPPRPNGGTTSS